MTFVGYGSESYFGDRFKRESLYLLYTEMRGKKSHSSISPFFSPSPLLFQELGTNTVPELPVEQMVEFSVTLTDQEYTDELSDPNSPQYRQLAAKFQLQVSEHQNVGFVPWLTFIL